MEVNQKQLASIIGITDRRVRQLREEGFFSFAENGKKYCLEKCVQEYIEYKVKTEVKSNTSVIDKEKEQAEHERIKKEISKLKLRKMKGELYEAKLIDLYFSDLIVNFRNKLLSIPNKVAISLVGEKDINNIVKILNTEIISSIEELSNYDCSEIIDDELYLDDGDEDE